MGAARRQQTVIPTDAQFVEIVKYNSHDNVYGAVVMSRVIARVHPVHVMSRLSAGWSPTLRPSRSTWAVKLCISVTDRGSASTGRAIQNDTVPKIITNDTTTSFRKL